MTINESASAPSVYNDIVTTSSGAITIRGLITINAANSGTGSTPVLNQVGSENGDTGTFSALGVSIIDSGSQNQDNEVQSNDGAVSIGRLGVTIRGSGSGDHQNDIKAFDTSSSLTIAGSATVIDTTSGSEYLEIDGAVIRGLVFVIMPGAGAGRYQRRCRLFDDGDQRHLRGDHGRFRPVDQRQHRHGRQQRGIRPGRIRCRCLWWRRHLYVLPAECHILRQLDPIFGPVLLNFQKVLTS